MPRSHQTKYSVVTAVAQCPSTQVVAEGREEVQVRLGWGSPRVEGVGDGAVWLFLVFLVCFLVNRC